jgi:hypothetical protein
LGAAFWLLSALAPADAPVSDGVPTRFAQVIIREQIIVRVPTRVKRAPLAPRIDWKEGKGPECVPAKSIVGAALLGENSVDLLLRNNSRIRAKLESSCPALDYYYGFYIKPHADGQICADRDTIRSRMGGQCEIEHFRSLTPKARD